MQVTKAMAEEDTVGTIRVRLYTSDGHFVTDAPFLPYKTAPEAVLWGSRFFVWREEYRQYREASVHYCVPNPAKIEHEEGNGDAKG